MKAVVFHGLQDIRVEDVPEPSPGTGQVKLRNAYCGICGTDIHLYYDPETSGSDLTRPHPLTGAMAPQILGHEFSGTVVELGAGVTGLMVGDRVTCYPVYWCGECPSCLAGRHACCPKAGFHGVTSHGGGLAAFTTVLAEQCIVLPDNVDLRTGALAEPMAVSWRAVRRSGATAESSVLIIGAGPIGIGAFVALRARGVERILVSEPSATRRSAIAGLGASVVDPAATVLTEAVGQLTGGHGVDVVIDAAGVGEPLLQAIGLLAPGGIAVIVGVHGAPVQIDPLQLLLNELTLTSVKAYDKRDFAEALEAMSQGGLDTTGWVEDVGLDDVESTIISLRAGHGVKVVVSVDG